MLRLLPNLNSADKIHNTTTLPTHSCLFIPCYPFSLHRASQGSFILVLFSFYPDISPNISDEGAKPPQYFKV